MKAGIQMEDRDKPTTLYFLVMKGQRRWLKVGIALSLARRLKDYKSAMPMFPLRVAHAVEMRDRFTARTWESTILFWFREKRVAGTEWVVIDAEVRDFLRRLRSGEDVEALVYRGAIKAATRPCDKIYRQNLTDVLGRIEGRSERWIMEYGDFLMQHSKRLPGRVAA